MSRPSGVWVTKFKSPCFPLLPLLLKPFPKPSFWWNFPFPFPLGFEFHSYFPFWWEVFWNFVGDSEAVSANGVVKYASFRSGSFVTLMSFTKCAFTSVDQLVGLVSQAMLILQYQCPTRFDCHLLIVQRRLDRVHPISQDVVNEFLEVIHLEVWKPTFRLELRGHTQPCDCFQLQWLSVFLGAAWLRSLSCFWPPSHVQLCPTTSAMTMWSCEPCWSPHPVMRPKSHRFRIPPPSKPSTPNLECRVLPTLRPLSQLPWAWPSVHCVVSSLEAPWPRHWGPPENLFSALFWCQRCSLQWQWTHVVICSAVQNDTANPGLLQSHPKCTEDLKWHFVEWIHVYQHHLPLPGCRECKNVSHVHQMENHDNKMNPHPKWKTDATITKQPESGWNWNWPGRVGLNLKLNL